jgi:asparagine synthase (glutamine-hydrolysing)
VKGHFSERGFDLALDQLRFVQGLYEETLQIQEPVALAHIDCDWYDSVKVCLERVVPHLVRGGRLVIDDYVYWTGCKMAVDEYFANRRNEFAFVMKARLHIIRLA